MTESTAPGGAIVGDAYNSLPRWLQFDPFNIFGLHDRQRSSGGPKRQQQAFENKQTTIARRGAWLPLCIGRNRIGPTVLAAGNRFSRQEVIGETVTGGGGGGKGGGGDDEEPKVEKIYQTVWFEDRWDGICLGPIDRVIGFYLDGKNILKSPISRPESSLPNPVAMGSPFSVKHEARPNIYWGNCEQPDTEAGSPISLGVKSLLDGPDSGDPESAWPWLCFIYQDNFRLGSSPIWPSIDFEIEWRIKNSPLVSSASWMDESMAGRGDWGVNPAHLILWLATAPSPWGAAMRTSDWNKPALEAFGELCEDEHLVMNFLVENGEDLSTAVSDILKDAGAVLAEVGGQVHVTPIREVVPASAPLIDDEVTSGAQPTNRIDMNPRSSTRLDFEFRGENVKLRTFDYALEDDGLAEKGFGFRKISKVELRTITNIYTAAQVADRRAMDELSQRRTFSMRMTHQGHKLIPGQAVRLGSIGLVRVTGRKLDAVSDSVEVNFEDDHYGVPVATIDPEDDDGFTPVFEDEAEPDTVFELIDAPRLAGPGAARFFIARHRANPTIEGAAIHFSNDDVTYDQVGVDRSNLAGGALLADLERYGENVIEDGPVIDAADVQEADQTNTLDLTGDEPGQFAGKQIVLIGQEVCFCRSLESLGGGQYRLKGFIRARIGTNNLAHDAGDRVYILSPDRFTLFTYIGAMPGTAVYVKAQPFVRNEIVDLGDLTPETQVVFGRGLRPLPIAFLNSVTNGSGAQQARTYVSTQDLLLTWAYRLIDLTKPTAGNTLPGAPISEVDSAPDGGMRIELRNAAGVLPNALISTYDGVVFSNTSAATILLTKTHTALKTLVLPNAFVQNVFGGQPTTFRIFSYQRLEDAGGSISNYESEALDVSIRRQDTATF
jgi:hypothetical protein